MRRVPRRVANAFAGDTGKLHTSYNELGVSSAMVCTNADTGGVHIRCAKRSSAALRTALTNEDEMARLLVESKVTDAKAAEEVLMQTQQSSDSGLAARIRRDAKNSLEQRTHANACGELPMLHVPLIGRVVRMWNDYYSLCSYCGCILRVYPQNRFGSEICCLRCDRDMMRVVVKPPEDAEVEKVCRYCGKVQADHGANGVFKAVKAPLDVSGPNAQLPAPLRVVHYCPAHFRSWLTNAHKALSTTVILSHLALNAKPLYDINKHGKAVDADFDIVPVKKRRRRGGGGR